MDKERVEEGRFIISLISLVCISMDLGHGCHHGCMMCYAGANHPGEREREGEEKRERKREKRERDREKERERDRQREAANTYNA